MAKSSKYYDITNLLSTKAQYLMLLGQRSNGKSYQVKETILKDAYKYIKSEGKDGSRFIYLRRWVTDIKAKAVKAYFEDFTEFKDNKLAISILTKGDFIDIDAWNGFIYFVGIDEKGDRYRSNPIGRYCALNEYERYKSQAFINYRNIVFEEFITDATYLNNEPTQLQQFCSTVLRNEEGTVFLVGNTLSRVCPYFNEWCLDGVLKQKQGTIEIYHHHVKDVDGNDVIINIAVEYCANANIKNTMFFGQSAKQIVSGEWDTKEVPKLPRKLEDYERVYEVSIVYQSFKFILDLLIEPEEGGVIVYIYPNTNNRQIDRILTEQFSDSPFISARLDTSKKPEYLINECFRRGKVCYSDNLTGADFGHVNEVFKIGKLI